MEENFMLLNLKTDGGGIIIAKNAVRTVSSQADNSGHWSTIMLTDSNRIDVLQDIEDVKTALKGVTTITTRKQPTKGE